MKRNILIIIFFFIICFAAGQSLSPQEEALKLFNEGKYSDALTRFKKYVTLFPNDPKYKYFTGVCMVQSNTGINDAINYLSSIVELAVPRDVYFYLGKAYHYQYKFDEAIAAYQKFKNFGTKKEQESLGADLYIKMAKNGMNIYQVASIKLLDKTILEAEAVFDYYNRFLTNGKFEPKAEKSFNFGHSQKGWRYVPSLLAKKQSIYEVNYTLISPNRDIFLVTSLENGKLSKPVNVGNAINSQEDENFPYFNEPESALYFASKGYNSIGGYDIFRSRYDPDTKTWSEPENLGYPVNSPYDDFLFVPSDDQKYACFASTRESKDGFITVYKIDFSQKFVYISISNNFKFQNFLNIEPKIAVEAVAIKKEEPKQVTNKISGNNELNNYPKTLINQKEYNHLLETALLYQIKSDSIYRIAGDKREKLTASNNEFEKNRLKSEISTLEKSAKQYQSQADVYYGKAREYEKQLWKEDADTPKENTTIAFTTERNKTTDLKKGGVGGETSNSSKSSQKVPVIYEFKVMAKSPYKSVSEIPINQPIPNGLIYRIQMGAFSNPIEPNRFKGIIPISGETVSNGKITKYYAGLFNRMIDAEKALNKIKEYGFKDAYIVAFYDGKSIPSNRATTIEKMQQN
jgi:tetratricopeptide (TPR) repeat protein